jgi:hypothetical protein
LTVQNNNVAPVVPMPPFVPLPPLLFPHVDASTGLPVDVVCHAVHPNGNLVATGSRDALVRLWSIADLDEDAPSILANTAPGLLQGAYTDGKDHLVLFPRPCPRVSTPCKK